MQKYLLIVASFLAGMSLQAQDITMSFPHLAGKTYEFFIFQGDKTVMVADTIPSDGKFVLSVPAEHRPYTGMCRWLITNTMEGGGLDLLIPGNDFSVSCLDPTPNDENIIYVNNNSPETLNRLYKEQQEIFNRYSAIEQVVKAYGKGDKAQKFFTKELNTQIKAYSDFQKKLNNESKYIAQFITIVNVTMGNATRLGINENEKALAISDYITNQLDWDMLYTSGHWSGIITAWTDIHTAVIKDKDVMASDMATIQKKLNPKLRKEFDDKVAYLQSRQ